MDIDIDIASASGQNIEQITKALEARRKELGETTKTSCVALIINVLKSLRGDTLVAKSNNANITIENLDSQYYASFANGRKHQPVVRNRNSGNVVENLKARFINKKYRKGLELHIYKVVDKRASDKAKEYIIVTDSEKKAYNYVKKIHNKRVRARKGLAKLALGIAMNKIHNENVNDNVTPQVGVVAKSNVDAKVIENGFDSGDIQIKAHDKIDYSLLALKSGKSGVDLAFKRTLNKMMGAIIHKLHTQDIFDGDYKIPFPEIKDKTK